MWVEFSEVRREELKRRPESQWGQGACVMSIFERTLFWEKWRSTFWVLSIVVTWADVFWKVTVEEQDGRWVGGWGVHLSLQIQQEYTFRHRSAYRTPAESRQEDWISGKEYKELGGKTGVLVGLNLPSARGGTEAGVQSLQQGSCLSQRRNI